MKHYIRDKKTGTFRELQELNNKLNKLMTEDNALNRATNEYIKGFLGNCGKCDWPICCVEHFDQHIATAHKNLN